ncbi:MAG TPA: MBL fold metallo-hydrolase, partial [Bacteroidota bacterium]|nr:MBL fold metallo-hydrolase [Bacteroidota bacterium]
NVNGARILLDCGMFQGRRAESEKRNRHLPFDPKSIDAVLLSHAHIDHSGNLPQLVKHGYRGPIYCTPATYDLCQIMLADSGHIQERDAEFINKKHAKRNEPLVEPLYTVNDAKETIKFFHKIPYHYNFEVVPSVIATFVDAGHILGSASIKIKAKEKALKISLGFTGDIGRSNMPIINDPQFMGNVDALICESTYGGTLHDPPTEMSSQLEQVITNALQRGGKIIIPAFSVGRTQDLIYKLHSIRERHDFSDIPIFLDSPLAVNATDIFRRHPECYDEETLDFLIANEDPFGMRQLHYIRSVEESKLLNERKSPCIIIAASGMCEAGRIRHHLANNIDDPRNTILIVGYQADHTLGRKLVDQLEEVTIFGDIYKRRADVVVLNSFSAHADGNELLKYIGRFDRKQLQQIFLIHGEFERQQALRGELNERGYKHVEIPTMGQKVDL